MHWYVLEEEFCQLLLNDPIESIKINCEDRRIEDLDFMTNPCSVITIDVDEYGIPII